MQLKLTRILVLLVALVNSTSLSLSAFGKEDNNLVQTADAKAYPGQDWELTNLNGQPVRLSQFKGQPVLLIFWATWCPYCKKLLPGIQTLHENYHERGLKIIAVNIKEDWKPHVYWKNHEYTFDAVLEGDSVAKIYGISATPGLVFIDPQGKVQSVQSFSDPNHPILEKFAEFYTKKLEK
jgi:cytochrome c biogenesis protein CcmG, thiol:disulfide interchange protein DsbE